MNGNTNTNSTIIAVYGILLVFQNEKKFKPPVFSHCAPVEPATTHGADSSQTYVLCNNALDNGSD